MIWHHIFAILGFTTFLYIGKSGTEICAVTFGAEITNPLVLLRWLMRDANCKNMYVVPLELIFAGAFVIFRIIFGTYFLYCGILNPKLDWVIKLFGLALYLVSWAFVVEIFGYHAKRLFITQQNVTKSGVKSNKKSMIKVVTGKTITRSLWISCYSSSYWIQKLNVLCCITVGYKIFSLCILAPIEDTGVNAARYCHTT